MRLDMTLSFYIFQVIFSENKLFIMLILKHLNWIIWLLKFLLGLRVNDSKNSKLFTEKWFHDIWCLCNNFSHFCFFLFFVFFCVFFFFFFFLGASSWPMEVSWLWGKMGLLPTPQPPRDQVRAVSATYTTVHSNVGSLTHWARPGGQGSNPHPPGTSWVC